MSIRTILAAAVVAGAFTVPALASERQGDQAISKKIEFLQSGQTRPVFEGRNSNRPAVGVDKSRAATSQGFAPVDTEASNRGFNN
jgi:hypothetical protein